MRLQVSRTTAAALGATVALGAGALAYGMLVERTAFRVRREILPILPRGARPLTVLHLSDLHMAPWQRQKQEWLRSLTIYEPDLIIDTGDNLGHVDGIAGVRAALSVFEGVPGVYVHGSNDYFGPVFKNPFTYFTAPSSHTSRQAELDTAALERFFEDDLGWLSLNNTAHALELRGSRLELFGTNDAHNDFDRLDEVTSSLDTLRETVSWNDEDDTGPRTLSIGVTHAPYRRILNSLVTLGADLIFAGHTHGGQVRIPGGPALVANCDLPRSQAQGLSMWRRGQHHAYLEVSAGIGTSIYAPVRFGCPPEAVVLTLMPVDIGR